MPGQVLSRGEAAETLATAFGLLSVQSDVERRWGYAPSEKATFKDVPVYAAHSAAVEALVAAGALQPCRAGADLFCPNAAESVADFDASLAALTMQRRKAGGASSANPVDARDAKKDDAMPNILLTRIKAAERLYQCLDTLHK